MLNIAKYSSALTVVAATGFLIGAILTDNGAQLTENTNYGVGSSNRKVTFKQPDMKNGFDVSGVLKALKLDGGNQNKVDPVPDENAIDRIITASIKRVQLEESKLSKKDQLDIQDRIKMATYGTSMENKVKPASGPTVIVQPGDTLYRIGLTHGLSTEKIAALNGISEPYTVRVGQKLRVK